MIDSPREYVSKTVNTVEVATKYAIGQYIVEDEQGGKERAKYGKAILKNLSERLTERYGDGWSVETLTLCRKFYSTYSKIVNSDYGIQKSISVFKQLNIPANLTAGRDCWFRLLVRMAWSPDYGSPPPAAAAAHLTSASMVPDFSPVLVLT